MFSTSSECTVSFVGEHRVSCSNFNEGGRLEISVLRLFFGTDHFRLPRTDTFVTVWLRRGSGSEFSEESGRSYHGPTFRVNLGDQFMLFTQCVNKIKFSVFNVGLKVYK